MKGPTNFRSFGRSPGETKFHVCHRMIGKAITMPTTAETFNGTVSPSVGVKMIALPPGMMLCEFPSTPSSAGAAAAQMKNPLKMKAIAVPTAQDAITQMRTRRNSSRCWTIVIRRSSSPATPCTLRASGQRSRGRRVSRKL